MNSDGFSVPPPLDATDVGPWENRDGYRARRFLGTRRGEAVPVQIVGLQDVHGAVIARQIRIGREQVELDIADVHKLIWTLADACNEADRLNHLSSEFERDCCSDLLWDVDSA
ncbi:hypothetical protein [Mycolicibacterium pulveris]|uniref:hypothetical protein n=1 Tax=Mycolicibacterium pulveris TaxID=36813 RepID=UPI003CEF57BE